MKLQPDVMQVQSISGYGPGWVGLGNEKIRHSVVIGARGERLDWQCQSFEHMGAEHFALLVDLQPELVIFGSGALLRFPPSVWIRPLIERQIGLETMDTQAACRTYNILAAEGRRVVAALLLDATQA